MNLEANLYNRTFSHIYVEREAEEYPLAQEIIKKFKTAELIHIEHYKDVFCRRKQNAALQRRSQALILAVKHGELIYKGSPMCQDFDNDNFYYCSSAMNCFFDCEYCYLKGMYSSSDIVVFLNIDDILEAVKKLAENQKIYLCVSYDTDLIALNSLTGYVERWVDFTRSEPNLTIEVRTKSSRCDLYEKLQPCDRVIWAYTMSPNEVISEYEHKTATLKERIEAANLALERGFKARLCFDPIIYCQNYKAAYKNMIEMIDAKVNWNALADVSVGSFRISKEYLKVMRRSYTESRVSQFPFETVQGVCEYPEPLKTEMENYLTELLRTRMNADRIYRTEY